MIPICLRNMNAGDTLIHYLVFQSRTHAFILEGKFRDAGIMCELTYLPGPLAADSCNIGIKLPQSFHGMTAAVVRCSGLHGIRLFQEKMCQDRVAYTELEI